VRKNARWPPESGLSCISFKIVGLRMRGRTTCWQGIFRLLFPSVHRSDWVCNSLQNIAQFLSPIEAVFCRLFLRELHSQDNYLLLAKRVSCLASPNINFWIFYSNMRNAKAWKAIRILVNTARPILYFLISARKQNSPSSQSPIIVFLIF
jgi:hypothetical protein